MTQLTKNFWLREFLKSDKASRMGRKVEATPAIVSELTRVALVLQAIRDLLSAKYKRECAVSITSGYRPKWLNTAIGGAKQSDHMDGRSGDFEVMGISNYDVCKFIEANINLFDIDKLIYEFGDWVHISVPKVGAKPRRQVMTAIFNPTTKKAEYVLGIVKQEEN